MVITVLRATVAAERLGDLERAYREGTAELTPGIRQTFLVRDTTERDTFLIVTHWVSREALDQMRASGGRRMVAAGHRGHVAGRC
jgi:heme-degrading monooxygenase HmoA